MLAALDGLPLELTLGRALSSVTAVLRGGAAWAGTVLLRGDMDALPVTERTGLDFASRPTAPCTLAATTCIPPCSPGRRALLAARQPELPGNVIFMFQPGEEGYGGAKFMIDEGVLDAAGERPAAAYALHVSSAELPARGVHTRPGPMMAAADVLSVIVRGHGGHASRPHNADDPIPAACEIVTALQTLVTRRFDVFDPVVITVGSFHAGTTDNVIPDEARLLGTVRTFSAATRNRVQETIARLVGGIAAAHGVSAETEFPTGYPVTVNDAAETAFAEQTATALFGAERFTAQPDPMTGAEDFSFVLEPGAWRVHHAGRLPG